MNDQKVLAGMDYIAFSAHLKRLAQEAERDCSNFIITPHWVGATLDIGDYKEKAETRDDDAEILFSEINKISRIYGFSLKKPNNWMSRFRDENNELLRRISSYYSGK